MAVVNWPALRKAMAACYRAAKYRYVSRFARKTGLNRRTIERVLKEEEPDAEVEMDTLVPWLYACGQTDVGAFLQRFVTPPAQNYSESVSHVPDSPAIVSLRPKTPGLDIGRLDPSVEAAHGDRAVSAALYAAILRDLAVTYFERADVVTHTGTIERPRGADAPPGETERRHIRRRREDTQGMG
jgi:hypothetical protein